MLKIVANVNNRTTLFLGLDRENTKRMHAGKPIVLDVQALTATVDASVQDIVMCAGESLADVHGELGRFLPLPPYEAAVSGD